MKHILPKTETMSSLRVPKPLALWVDHIKEFVPANVIDYGEDGKPYAAGASRGSLYLIGKDDYLVPLNSAKCRYRNPKKDFCETLGTYGHNLHVAFPDISDSIYTRYASRRIYTTLAVLALMAAVGVILIR